MCKMGLPAFINALTKGKISGFSPVGGVGIAKSMFKPGEQKPSAPRGSYVDPATGQTVLPPGVSAQPSNAPATFPSLGVASGGGSMSGVAKPTLFALRSK